MAAAALTPLSCQSLNTFPAPASPHADHPVLAALPLLAPPLQLYKFECQHGTTESQEAVLKKAAESEPNTGERWCRVAKDPKHAHLPKETLLKKTVVDIDTLPPP